MAKYEGISPRGKKGFLQIEYYDAQGHRVRKSTGTTDWEQARRLRDRYKADAWRQIKLGERPAFLWQNAVVRWLRKREHKRSLHDDKMHLRWLRNYLDGKQLSDIDRSLLDEITQARLAGGVSHATVNRTLQVIRGILRIAYREWGWLDKVPAIRMLPEPKRRIRWLTREEANGLLRELPEHLADMVRFTLATGLRESNVVELEWSQIDLGRRTAWIYADQAKAKRSFAVPLNDAAVTVIKQQVGKHPTRVFTYQGQPVNRCNNHAWRKALKRAGIGDFRWHDLRHTWASWHIQAGTPLHVLRELGDWSGMDMVMRYAHLGGQHLQAYAAAVETPQGTMTSVVR